ncbi:hypothetical protein BH09DEP1_BH09DEP1_2050 [soil metagenome]
MPVLSMHPKSLIIFITLISIGHSANTLTPKAQLRRGKAMRNFTICMGNSLLAYAAISEADPSIRLFVCGTGVALLYATCAFTTAENAYEKMGGGLTLHEFIEKVIIDHNALVDEKREEYYARKREELGLIGTLLRDIKSMLS